MRDVLSAGYGVVIGRQLSAIHGVEQSHRDPELRHALLRKQFVAVIIDHPVRIDALDGNADMTIEIPAHIMDDLDEGRRGLAAWRSEEHTSELQSLMRISYAVFCLKKKT